MNNRFANPAGALAHPIDAFLAEHGAWRVLLRAAKMLVAPRSRPAGVRLNASQLGDYLRRDIGLPPGAGGLRHWSDLR